MVSWQEKDPGALDLVPLTWYKELCFPVVPFSLFFFGGEGFPRISTNNKGPFFAHHWASDQTKRQPGGFPMLATGSSCGDELLP